MKYTRKLHEEWLNGLYDPEDALRYGAYMKRATRLLQRGKYGTAMRKYDPQAFNISHREGVDANYL